MGYLVDSTVVCFLSGRVDDSARSGVEQELARCRRCAALVAEIMHGCSVVHLEPRRDPPDLEATGELGDPATDPQSSRYLVGAEIARGGMASIVGAFDRRLTRSIALKLLEGDSPRLAARFEREIRITASLQNQSELRHASANDLAADLRRFHTGQASATTPLADAGAALGHTEAARSAWRAAPDRQPENR